jgi:hypothetical protein
LQRKNLDSKNPRQKLPKLPASLSMAYNPESPFSPDLLMWRYQARQTDATKNLMQRLVHQVLIEHKLKHFPIIAGKVNIDSFA